MKSKFKKRKISNSKILIVTLSVAAVFLIAANIVFVSLYLSGKQPDSVIASAPSDEADVLRR